ncbi:MAG: hypothetical protein Q8O33_05380 [Pseudomonadota bacterium]|nr:hypothetical protein [Pseudomonadota bacterium]
MNAMTHLIAGLLGAVLLCVPSPPALAAGYAETAAAITAARKNMEAAQQAINDSQHKLQTAIDKVESAEHFEGPHWRDLDQAMKDWSDTVAQQGGVIDGEARVILRLAPQVQIPMPTVTRPAFKPLVKRMESIANGLQASIDRAEQMKRQTLEMDAKVKAEMKQGTGKALLETTKDLANIPNDAGDLVAKLLVLPLQVAYSGVKMTWGLYYYAEEMKSGVRVLKTGQEKRAFADEFIRKTLPNLASARQGVQFLEGYGGKAQTTLTAFYTERNKWMGLAQEATREKTREADQAFEEVLAKPAPKLQLGNFWPAPMTYLEPSDYESDAESILRELRSAALAAVDGGSPLAYHEIKNNHLRGLAEQTKPAQERHDKARDVYREAQHVYIAAYNAAWDAYRACGSRCWKGNRTAEVLYPCLDSCSAARDATYAGVRAQAMGPATSLAEATRALSRLRHIAYLVKDRSYVLDRMIEAAAHAARTQYSMLWSEHDRRFGDAGQDANANLSQIPSAWQLGRFEEQAASISGHIKSELSWGKNPGVLRNQLADDAQRIRDTGRIASRALADYQETLQRERLAAQQAETELGAFLAKFGPLLSYHGNPDYHTQATVDEYTNGAQSRLRKHFQVIEPDYLAAAKRFPYEATARRIEDGLADLDDLNDRIELFRYRLSIATATLDKISQALTGKPAFGAHDKPARQLALMELRGGQWAGFAGTLEKQVLNGELRATIQSRYATAVDFDKQPPRQLLLYAQGALLHLVREDMRHYIPGKPTRFQRVDEKKFKQIEKLWQDMKPLYSQFDTLAASERAKLDSAQALFPDEVRLSHAYSAIPDNLRGLVYAGYQRYRGESSWLRDYMEIKQSALQTVSDGSTNNVMAELQNLIESYPDDLAAWSRRQAEIDREYQAARRLAEEKAAAEERARQAREEQERLAAQASLESVHKLYEDFVQAYQAKNLGKLTRLMTNDWKAADGSDLYDLEDILDNSFRVFDRIGFQIQGMRIQPLGSNRYSVSYGATLTGEIQHNGLIHKETSQVEDVVSIGPEGARISATRGGQLWMR